MSQGDGQVEELQVNVFTVNSDVGEEVHAVHNCDFLVPETVHLKR